MADIIKLDEYLERNKYNIVRAITEALGMDPRNSEDVESTREMYDSLMEGMPSEREARELEQTIVEALDNENVSELAELLRINQTNEESMLFDGVDVAEGYNFRCAMKTEVAKNGLMDWLEENSIDYLIDNDGNFAIKCASRNSHYHVNQHVERVTNQWDKPSFGKNVGSIEQKPGLGDVKRPALSDNINEDEKDNLFYDTTHSGSPFTDIDDEECDDDDEKEKKNEHVMETKGKKKKKKKKKKAEDKLSDQHETSKMAGGENPAAELSQAQYKPKTVPDKKKTQDKKEARKKVKVDENSNLDEGVLGGLLSIPTLGRIKELAGIQSEDCVSGPDDNTITVTVEPDPGTPKVEMLPGIGEATELLGKAFEIYNTLDPESQKQFQMNMVSQIMGPTLGLKESENISEYRMNPPSRPLTRDDRKQIATSLGKLWREMVHLVEDWKPKTGELKNLELAIVLLKKLERKIGQGLV